MAVIDFNEILRERAHQKDSFDVYQSLRGLGIELTTDTKKHFEANFERFTFKWCEGLESIIGEVSGMKFYFLVSEELVQEFGLNSITAMATMICFCNRVKGIQS